MEFWEENLEGHSFGKLEWLGSVCLCVCVFAGYNYIAGLVEFARISYDRM